MGYSIVLVSENLKNKKSRDVVLSRTCHEIKGKGLRIYLEINRCWLYSD